MFKKPESKGATAEISEDLRKVIEPYITPRVEAARQAGYSQGQKDAYEKLYKPQLEKLTVKLSTITAEHDSRVNDMFQYVSSLSGDVAKKSSESEKAAKQSSEALRSLAKTFADGVAKFNDMVAAYRKWSEEQAKNFDKETKRPL
jgi:flagellar biosynthesis/type III secretory pathway protein FliH